MAATIKLIEQGRIPRDESIVVSITGNGLKTQEVVADELPYPKVIDAKLSDFDALLKENGTSVTVQTQQSPKTEKGALASTPS